MNNIEYMPLNLKHKTINRWKLSKLEEKTVSFTPMTMEGDINKWLIEGFAINENPCKIEFREDRRGNIPVNPLVSDLDISNWEVYFPWENPAVERSGFWFVPTYLKSYAVTYMECNYEHKAILNLRTCGGMTLWINDSFITDFTPFTRNIEGSVEVEVELKKGTNKLAVCFDDLAERDTYYYFRIDYMGQDEVKIILPIDDNDKEEIYKIEKMISEAQFIDDIIKEGEVSLHINNLLNRDLEFEFSYETDQLTDNDCKKKSKSVLKKGDNKLNMGNINEFPMGFNYIDLVITIGNIEVSKKLGVMIFDKKHIETKENYTMEQRKTEALKCVAQYGDYNIHKALAILSTGGDVKEAEAIILRGLDGINKRRDCSDFYLISMFRIWKEYRETSTFSEEFWVKVKECILNFRYWIDELGDDVMWFFSENHALLFHSCELLASQLFPEDMFTNSNQPGSFHRTKAEALLKHWFERFLEEGLAEWNSSMYMPVDVVGIINIYDLAESSELRELAKKSLDLIYYLLAVNSHKGIMATTFGRCYEKELKGHYANGTTSLIWIGYGTGYLNNYSISNVSLCLSDYEPPVEYKKYITMDNMNSYIFKNEQGYEGYAKVYNYKTKDFSLSSIYNFRGGKKGYQEHVAEAVIDAETQVWVNHPGQMYHFGKGRPNFWAGNGYLPNVLQYKGLCALTFSIDEAHDADYTHAYFPSRKFDEVIYKENWVFAKKDNSFIGIYASNGLTLQNEGFNKDKELISKGRNNLWLLRITNKEEFSDFEAFVSEMLKTNINFSEALELNMKEAVYGDITASFDGTLKVDGVKQEFEKVGVKGIVEILG
jgi:hypothetical protein